MCVCDSNPPPVRRFSIIPLQNRYTVGREGRDDVAGS